jgi:hypothetical protein
MASAIRAILPAPGTAPDATGYYQAGRHPQGRNACNWERLFLTGTNSIPADCNLLIIASGRESPADGPAFLQ